MSKHFFHLLLHIPLQIIIASLHHREILTGSDEAIKALSFSWVAAVGHSRDGMSNTSPLQIIKSKNREFKPVCFLEINAY